MSYRMRRFLTLFLLLCLLCQSLSAIAEEAESTEEYVANASVTLKVRRTPDENSSGVESLSAGSTVYILELGDDWTRIRTSRTEGYVRTQYLEDIRSYNASIGQEASAEPQAGNAYASFTESDFRESFRAYAVKDAIIRSEPDERSRYVTKALTYDEVIVSHIIGEWCYVSYNGYKGYTLCSSLFKWDRIDPFSGTIPGCIVYPTLAFVGKTTEIKSMENSKKVLKTINPGAAICVELPDAEGRYKTPYWRTTGYITQEDIVYTLPVVPYEEAQPGDLISAYSSYYALGVSTLQFQGRNWNIYLSNSLLSGVVVEPEGQYNMNKTIGPYRKSTGYKSAPIMSPDALSGYGGGTCQTNTALYNTLIQLPLYIDHRKVHANVGVKYAPKGFDAAVGGGDINMIFTNTLPYAIRLQTFMSDGVVTLCVFREP